MENILLIFEWKRGDGWWQRWRRHGHQLDSLQGPQGQSVRRPYQNRRATDCLLLAGSLSSTLMFKLRSQHVENSFCQSWRRGEHKTVRCFFEELAPLFTLGSSPWPGFAGPRGGIVKRSHRGRKTALGSHLWARGKTKIKTAALSEPDLSNNLWKLYPLGCGSMQGLEMVPKFLGRLVALRRNGEDPRATYRGQTHQLGAP